VVTSEASVAGSPTVRMRQLGKELRLLREAANISVRQAATLLGKDESALSRWETGARRVDVATVMDLCDLYKVDDERRIKYLVQLAREANQRGWWAEYGKDVPSWLTNALGMETVANEVWIYQSEYVPGLLQTQPYLHALEPSNVEAAMKMRAARQKRLTEDTNPVVLRAVLNEAVVLRTVGGSDVMRQQIRHIIDAAQRPNVTVQVLPFAIGHHPAMTGPFTALRFPETPAIDTIYVELKDAAVYIEKPSEVDRYTTDFERLTQLALDEEETIAFLEQLVAREEDIANE